MLFFLVALAMVAGMAGIVAPFIPGLTIMWLAALLYGFAGDHFETTGIICFAIITVLFVVGEVLGYVLPGRAASKAGAPASSIAIGALVACVGFFVIPVFGFMIGGIGGIFLAELVRTRSSQLAWSTTVSTLIGFGVSALAQLGFGVGIILTWLAWVVLT